MKISAKDLKDVVLKLPTDIGASLDQWHTEIDCYNNDGEKKDKPFLMKFYKNASRNGWDLLLPDFSVQSVKVI